MSKYISLNKLNWNLSVTSVIITQKIVHFGRDTNIEIDWLFL